MGWVFAAIVMVAVIMVVLAKRSQNIEPGRTSFPYQKSEALFSPAERSFLGVLQQAVGNHAAIFGKVRVADVLEPGKGLGRRARQKAFHKVSARHFDFLLCDSQNLSSICAIELNDASHPSDSRCESDEFLRGVCEAAGVPLVQVPAKSGYAINEVKRLLARHLTRLDTPYRKRLQALDRPESEAKGKICPNCSSSMVKRVAKKGTCAGKAFWACSAFPKCKTVEAIKT